MPQLTTLMPKIKNQPIQGVPTNIITGFLGVGKTSTILHLLSNKPSDERWAILVNEFGEIGIDGALFEGQYSESKGVYIREVPGGCMCCTAGLPMRVALTQLIRQAKPDRLLIEPTGLGHPKEVLNTLNEQAFQGVLSIQKTITLVDARQLSDKRYAEHDVFQQQLAIADVIVANKQDLYTQSDETALHEYLDKHSLNNASLVFTKQGVIQPSLLNGEQAIENKVLADTKHDHSTHQHSHSDNSLDTSIPECGFIKALNSGEGFVSVGWRFSSVFEFDQHKLFAFLSGIEAERLKATFMTNNGDFAYNLTPDALTELAIESLDESRIEIIASEINSDWEEGLFACVNKGA